MIIHKSTDKIEEIFRMAVTKTPDILLSPCITSQFFKYRENLKWFNVDFAISNYIDFTETSILSKNRLKSRPLFQCFRCFDTNIWALILISILLLSLLSSFRNMSVHTLYENVWNYSITLLRIDIQNFINISIKKSNVTIYAWLIPALFLNTIFVSYFFDDMILPTPITKIDTIDDLFDSDMRIYARSDSALYTYLTSIESPVVYRFDTYQNVPSLEKLFYGLRTGSLAYVNHKFPQIFYVLDIISMFNLESDKDFIDSLHFSKENGGSEPFFLPINGDMDKDINIDFNIM